MPIEPVSSPDSNLEPKEEIHIREQEDNEKRVEKEIKKREETGASGEVDVKV